MVSGSTKFMKDCRGNGKMSERILLCIGLLAFLTNGCVPPEKPPGRFVRVAVLQGADAATVSAKSVLTVRDSASGRVLSSASRGTPITIRPSPGGITIAGKPYPVRELHLKSTSGEVSLNGRTYPGTLKILRRQTGLLAVNLVDLVTYLKAVVPSEMPPSWPQEALKAQAVVSRSFVLSHALRNSRKDFDISSTTQVYNPAKRDPRTDKAVDATRNIVLFYKGKLLLPYFCHSCGGFTEYAANVWGAPGEFPRLGGVKCPFCRDAPDYRWRARMSLSELQKKLRSAGIARPRSIAVHRRSLAGGRITALKIESDDGDKTLRLNTFRAIVGPDLIRSGFFEKEVSGGYITFSGRGWGHGVGMCQQGARAMAARGKSFRSILSFYFPGARIRKP